MNKALLALLLLAAPAWPKPAPPRYTAGDLFQAMLEAQDHQAWMQAVIIKSETAAGSKKEPTVTRGRLQTKPFGRARLEIEEPAPGLIVADGKKLYVELTDVKQVMRYDEAKLAASGNFFLDLASSIRHYSKASRKRLIAVGEGFDADHVSALEMSPSKPEQAGFERMRVWVDERRWVVLRVQLDYGGTKSDVRFNAIKTMTSKALKADPGQALAKELFEYKVPKGFEVYDLDL